MYIWIYVFIYIFFSNISYVDTKFISFVVFFLLLFYFSSINIQFFLVFLFEMWLGRDNAKTTTSFFFADVQEDDDSMIMMMTMMVITTRIRTMRPKWAHQHKILFFHIICMYNLEPLNCYEHCKTMEYFTLLN